MRGSYFSYESKYIRNLPIQHIDATNVEYEHKHHQTEILVDHILVTKQQDPTANTLKWEAKVDALVFDLYGLTETEMLYVLNSLKVNDIETNAIQMNFRDIRRGHFRAEI